MSMLHDALTAFRAADTRAVPAIVEVEDAVDEMYNQVNRALVIIISRQPEMIDAATSLMWVSHNLERLADPAIHICERTVFLVTGEMLELGNSEIQ